jgi:hypothetical protein
MYSRETTQMPNVAARVLHYPVIGRMIGFLGVLLVEVTDERHGD